jgi:hypothetical protein
MEIEKKRVGAKNAKRQSLVQRKNKWGSTAKWHSTNVTPQMGSSHMGICILAKNRALST